jgi:glucuronate isomerase
MGKVKIRMFNQKGLQRFEDLRKALKNRHDYFHALGCRASDHGISKPFSAKYTEQEIDKILKKGVNGEPLTSDEIEQFKSAFLYECAILDQKKGWVWQLHIGALRNNNSRMFKKLGTDSGYDSMGDVEMARPLSSLLDRLDSTEELPKTIIYNLNPRDNELIGAMIGNFQDGITPGKLQHGPPWWFLDQKDGIEKQIESLSNMGILSQFIGMTTDSRSFLSFSRHDYFRRILCNLIGFDMESGIIPDDFDMASDLIEKICFKNVKSYFAYSK